MERLKIEKKAMEGSYAHIGMVGYDRRDKGDTNGDDDGVGDVTRNGESGRTRRKTV